MKKFIAALCLLALCLPLFSCSSTQLQAEGETAPAKTETIAETKPVKKGEIVYPDSFAVGYARAAKLIDFMAEMNVVGEYAGSKPREVLWTEQYYAEYKMRALEDHPIN